MTTTSAPDRTAPVSVEMPALLAKRTYVALLERFAELARKFADEGLAWDELSEMDWIRDVCNQM